MKDNFNISFFFGVQDFKMVTYLPIGSEDRPRARSYQFKFLQFYP